jgi:hypothetical protein
VPRIQPSPRSFEAYAESDLDPANGLCHQLDLWQFLIAACCQPHAGLDVCHAAVASFAMGLIPGIASAFLSGNADRRLRSSVTWHC